MIFSTVKGAPYRFSLNNKWVTGGWTGESYQKWLWCLKELIVRLGWRVIASSDGTSVKNVGDADPDLWIDKSKILYGTTWNNPCSWIIFRDDYTDMALCINCKYENFRWWWYYGEIESNGTTVAAPGGLNIPGNLDVNTAMFDVNGLNDGAWHGMVPVDRKGITLISQIRAYDTRTYSYIITLNPLTSIPSKAESCWYASGDPGSTTTDDGGPPFTKVLQSIEHRVLCRKADGEYIQTDPIELTTFFNEDLSGPAVASYTAACSLENDKYLTLPIGTFDYENLWGHFGYLRDIWFGQYINPTGTLHQIGKNRYMQFGAWLVPWNNEPLIDLSA